MVVNGKKIEMKDAMVKFNDTEVIHSPEPGVTIIPLNFKGKPAKEKKAKGGKK